MQSTLLVPSLPPKLSFFTCHHHIPQPHSLSNLPPLPYHTHDTLICRSTTRNNINGNNKESPWDPYDHPHELYWDSPYDRNGKKKSPWDPYDHPHEIYWDWPYDRNGRKESPYDPYEPYENPVERHEEMNDPLDPYKIVEIKFREPIEDPFDPDFNDKPVRYVDSDPSVSYKELKMADNDILIDGDGFHKISLLGCDFFIRKPQDDLDNDLYDFREVYVKPPESDAYWIPYWIPEEMYVKPPQSNVYWIPKVLSPMPEEHTRCSKKVYYRCIANEYARRKYPQFGIEEQITKVFLIKHCGNRRINDPELFLDFEETYVLDASTKSITRAKVSVTVPEARNRDKLKDMMIRCLEGDSFEITRMYSDYRLD
ncbi:hypothetical protein AAC387_Pa02g3359 [Persea americana]